MTTAARPRIHTTNVAAWVKGFGILAGRLGAQRAPKSDSNDPPTVDEV